MRQRMLLVFSLMLTLLLIIPMPLRAQQPEAMPETQVHDGETDTDVRETLERLYGPQVADGLAQSLRYHIVHGSLFQQRDSDVTIAYQGGGCISRPTGVGEPDDAAPALDLQLPSGTTIIGMQYYYYDTAATESLMTIYDYDGSGGVSLIATAASNGDSGYGSTYHGFSTPYVVDNFSYSLALGWYPPDANHRLCGVRLALLPGSMSPVRPEVEPDGSDSADAVQRGGSYYAFYAGASFQRRNSTDQYTYEGDGCMTSATGGAFTIDVNLPSGAIIQGVRLYWYDVSVNSIVGFLTSYTGQGGSNDHLVFPNTGADTGYSDAYFPLTTPYTVNHTVEATVLTATMPADENVWLCGMRVFYDYTGMFPLFAPVASQATEPEVENWMSEGEAVQPLNLMPSDSDADLAPLAPTSYYRRIAGSTMQPWDTAGTYSYPGSGCFRMTNGNQVIAPLTLPQGARLLGVRMYYYDPGAANSTMFVTSYDLRSHFDEFIIGSSEGDTGYGSEFFEPSYPYFINNRLQPIGITWNPGTTDGTQYLCGYRFFYELDSLTPVYLPVMLK